MSMKQKDAVFQAIQNVMSHEGGKCEPTDEQKKMISAILIEGFKSGKIALSREYDDKGMKEYVSGLLSNWLRKDTRLNGGAKYVAKNPGSRAGATDPSIKAMKALLTTLEPDSDDYKEVSATLEEYTAKIQAEKQQKVVNYDALPEALKLKFQK